MRTIDKLNLDSNVLPVQVSVIVPSTERNKLISNSEFNKRVMDEKRWFDSVFGGDTSVETLGGYVGSGNKLITERGARVSSSMSVQKYKSVRNKLASHFRSRRKEWKQETILYSIEGVDFITPKKGYIDHESGLKRIDVT